MTLSPAVRQVVLMGRRLRRRLVGNRNHLPNTNRPSDGTNDSFNVKLKRRALTDLVNAKPAFVGFHFNDSTEANYAATVSYHVQIQVGSIFYDCGTTVVAGGTILVEASAGVPFIAAGTDYFVWIHGSVSSGAIFYSTDHFGSGSLVQLSEVGIGLTDKSDGTAFTNQSINIPGGFCGMMASVPASNRSVATIGDSILAGNDTDPMTRYFDLVYDWVEIARSGSAAVNSALAYTKRAAFLTAAGITDVVSDFGINDLSAGNRSAATTRTGLESLYAIITAAGVARIWQTTITPQVTDPPGDVSDVNQTIVANLADGRRQTLNTLIRARSLAGQYGYIEWALAVENALNDGWWVSGTSADGLHPNVTAVTGGQVIIYNRMVTDHAFAL